MDTYFREITKEEKEKIKSIRNEPIRESEAIAKMLNLFEYSYLDSESEEKKEEIIGKIGLLLSSYPGGGLFVRDVFPGSPAEKANIKAGWLIVGIDDLSLKGVSFRKAVGRISGDCGSFVELTIFREGAQKPLKVKVKREEETWATDYVRKGLISPDIGYIKLSSFYLFCERPFGEAVKYLREREPKDG